jgi:predicted GNAT superfamily acetyltransferase
VLPGTQNQGVGYALKLHQRDWALDRGIELITWTFDPLVCRNAHFNLARLGVLVDEYHVDFYGVVPDAINAGDETDRCVARWELTAERKERHASEAGGVALLVERDGRPVATGCVAGDDDAALVAVPRDIQEIRATDPALAREWRVAVRETLGVALRKGFVADGFVADDGYVLHRNRSV